MKELSETDRAQQRTLPAILVEAEHFDFFVLVLLVHAGDFALQRKLRLHLKSSYGVVQFVVVVLVGVVALPVLLLASHALVLFDMTVVVQLLVVLVL